MPRKRGLRKTITLDLNIEQIAWLDQQAGDLESRSAYVRRLIASLMESQCPRR
jgi:hypothetical protein